MMACSLVTLSLVALATVPVSAVPSQPSSVRCTLPNDPNIVPITPNALNRGWAMSVDQECKPGMYCPYACVPGYYSNQWNPESTLTSKTMDGGLICQEDGTLRTPFPDRPLCSPGLQNARIVNSMSKSVSACQTVYPGNEEMLIASVAKPGQDVTLNVLPTSYWQATSAQYYVNPAGTDQRQCQWGKSSAPIGNWAPFVFGAGQGMGDVTFISVRYNPDYQRAGNSGASAYNVRIECDDPSRCLGLPCQCAGGECSKTDGCTVSVLSGGKASFVLYGDDNIHYTTDPLPDIPIGEVPSNAAPAKVASRSLPAESASEPRAAAAQVQEAPSQPSPTDKSMPTLQPQSGNEKVTIPRNPSTSASMPMATSPAPESAPSSAATAVALPSFSLLSTAALSAVIALWLTHA